MRIKIALFGIGTALLTACLRPPIVSPGAAAGNPAIQRVAVEMDTFSFAFTPARLSAGVVKFTVKNNAAGMIHEFLIYKTDLPVDKMPLSPGGAEIDETSDLIEEMGAVDDVEPDATAEMTVTLDAGHYVYVCNIAGHYMAGMAGEFTLPAEGAIALKPLSMNHGAMGMVYAQPVTPTQVVTVSMTNFAFSFAPALIRAGTVRFLVRNDAPDVMHEIFLVKTDLAVDKLPMTPDGKSVDENSSAFTSLGRVEDLAAGQSGEMIVKLEPGRYVYFCPSAAHYKLGMAGEMLVVP